jgi:putative transposase
MDPKSHRYKSRRRGQAELERRIREICETRVRYGYRRVLVLLRRDGMRASAKSNMSAMKEMELESVMIKNKLVTGPH